jgi:ATP-dependent Lhr-like helicase
LPLRPDFAAGILPGSREAQLIEELGRQGAAFFADIHDATGGGYPGETLDALWGLVWRGIVTNDTLHALRAYIAPPASSRQAKRQHNLPSFHSRRTTPPAAQGRWSLVPAARASATERSYSLANQLLHRYGIVLREVAAQEDLPGGFSAVYDVLKALEARSSVRRGYFVAGLGATQFALPSAVDLLRGLRKEPPPEKAEMVYLAAADPANPYGAVLRWPETPEEEGSVHSLARNVGASVILRNGALLAYLRRNNTNLQVFLPDAEPERSHAARDLSLMLGSISDNERRRDEGNRQGLLISTINGHPASRHFLSLFLNDAGFRFGPRGFHVRRLQPTPSPAAERSGL